MSKEPAFLGLLCLAFETGAFVVRVLREWYFR